MSVYEDSEYVNESTLIDIQNTIITCTESEAKDCNIDEKIIEGLSSYELSNELYVTIRSAVKKR